MRKRNRTLPISPNLTDREQQVLTLVGTGKRNKDIAVVMEISENTVEAHLKAIFKKLKVRNRVQAVLACPKQAKKITDFRD